MTKLASLVPLTQAQRLKRVEVIFSLTEPKPW